MPSRVENLQKSLEKEYRKIDIRRMKKIAAHFKRVNDEVSAGAFHDAEHQGLINNVRELAVETRARLLEAIAKAEA